MPEAREGWAEKELPSESDSEDGREPLTSGTLPGQPSALHPDLLRLSRRWVVVIVHVGVHSYLDILQLSILKTNHIDM